VCSPTPPVHCREDLLAVLIAAFNDGQQLGEGTPVTIKG
jgi:hypothetical protein